MGMRASNNVVKYLGRAPLDPKDSLATRQAKRLQATRRSAMVANTVAEWIAILSKLPPDTVPFTIDPPFDGVKVSVQGDGKILLCRPRIPESKNRIASK